MAKNLSVLLLSQSGTRLNMLEDALLDHSGIATIRKILSPQSRNPLADLTTQPDLVLLDLGEDWQAELFSVAEDSSTLHKPPLIVLGSADDPAMMRKAMQAGARDFFTSPISEDELVASIRQIGRESQQSQRQGSGKITSVINGKGGSGGTIISTNLATFARGKDKKNPESVVIVDLDLQFGDVPVYFDLESNDSLMQALVAADNMDAVALEGLLQSHESGIQVIASKPDQIRSTEELNPSDVVKFISALNRNFDHVILDIPRVLDPVVIAALELSDSVLVTMQQSVPHVRDTRYLLSLLRDIGISRNSIRIVLNRYDKKGEIRLNDMRSVFQEVDFYLVPEDIKRVSFSVNNGIPLTLRWPKTPFSKAIADLAGAIWQEADGARGRSAGLFRRAN